MKKNIEGPARFAILEYSLEYRHLARLLFGDILEYSGRYKFMSRSGCIFECVLMGLGCDSLRFAILS